MKTRIQFTDEKAIAELTKSLTLGPILPNGRRLPQAVCIGRINSLKIEIYAVEHPPPHFHVVAKARGINASFSIKDCSLEEGDAHGYHRNIKKWHKENKEKLIDTWNATRPTNCPVGPYKNRKNLTRHYRHGRIA